MKIIITQNIESMLNAEIIKAVDIRSKALGRIVEKGEYRKDVHCYAIYAFLENNNRVTLGFYKEYKTAQNVLKQLAHWMAYNLDIIPKTYEMPKDEELDKIAGEHGLILN